MSGPEALVEYRDWTNDRRVEEASRMRNKDMLIVGLSDVVSEFERDKLFELTTHFYSTKAPHLDVIKYILECKRELHVLPQVVNAIRKNFSIAYGNRLPSVSTFPPVRSTTRLEQLVENLAVAIPSS
jgi:hypothetical protein